MQGQQRKSWLRGIFALCLIIPGCGYGSFSDAPNEDQSGTPTLGASVEDPPADTTDTTVSDSGTTPGGGTTPDSDSMADATDPLQDPVVDDGTESGDPPMQPTEPEPTSVIVKFRTGSKASDRAALHRENRLTVDRTIPQLQVHTVSIPEGKTAKEVMALYKRRPLVEYVEVEKVASPAVIPNDPWYYREPTNLWHLPVIDAPAAWDITTGSSDVIIAILDTGVDGAHEDLRDNVISGWNIVRNNNDTRPFALHGTLVAGQAGAASNNGIGVAAPAWDCSIMPIVVTEDGWSSSVRLASGVIWAADHGARIANMSFEIDGLDVLYDAGKYIQDRGGVAIQSAGNSGTVSSIPDSPYILKISGTDWNDNVWSRSVTGSNIDLSAPATDIGTTSSGGAYGFGTGTSASAPIVSGVAALMLSVNPNLSGQDIQDILKQSADDLGPRGWDPGYGWGRVNARRAVEMARDWNGGSQDSTPPTVAIEDPISGEVVSGTSSVLANANDNDAVSQVDLYCDGELVSSDTSAPHQWWIDTMELPNGNHTFFARAFDASGNQRDSDPVVVDVQNACECPADCSTPAIAEVPNQTCNDGVDNDCDGFVDCDDANCLTDSACFFTGCGNGVCEADEDKCSCAADCGSPDSRERNCSDGDDNDCDGVTDCDDADCVDDAACFVPGCGNGVCETDEDTCSCPEDCGTPPSSEAKCADGVDNDCDGRVDCDDSDCGRDAACDPCGDGVCDPLEGEDRCTCSDDCGAPPIAESDCVNGEDEDCDGFVDCEDGDCAGDLACLPDPCGDGSCDALNGEDGCTCPEDCGAAPTTETACTDGMDDDCDGLADGDDPDCSATPWCGNGVCDGDGEDCYTCPEDCGCRGKNCRACCGDGVCSNPGENKNSCPVDCAR